MENSAFVRWRGLRGGARRPMNHVQMQDAGSLSHTKKILNGLKMIPHSAANPVSAKKKKKTH